MGENNAKELAEKKQEAQQELAEVEKQAESVAEHTKQAEIEKAKEIATEKEQQVVQKEEQADNKEKKKLQKKIEKAKEALEEAKKKKDEVRKTLQDYYTDATAKLNDFKSSSEVQVATSTPGYSKNQVVVTSLIVTNVLSALALGKYYSENRSLQNFKTGFLEEF